VSDSFRQPWIRDVLLLDLPEASGATVRLWTAAALASLVASIWVAFLPGHLHDFWELRSWLVTWLIHGGNPYINPALEVDYPPSAFLILAPLGLFSDQIAAEICVVASAMALVAANWLLLRWINERLGRPLPTLLVLALTAVAISSGAARAATWQGQTIAIGMLFGVLALRASDRHPIRAAIWLGLAAFKPHVALAFGLGILFTRGPKIPLISLPVFVVMCLLFAPTVGRTPGELAGDFLGNVARMYGEGNHTTATTLVEAFEPALGARGAGVVHGSLAIAVLALIAFGAWRRRHDQRSAVFVVAAGLMWSLVFLPHQRYGAVLAAPVWWLLLIPGANLVRSERLRVALAAGMTIYSVLDLQLTLRFTTRAATTLFDSPAWTNLMQATYNVLIAESAASPLRLVIAACLCLVVRAISRGTEEFSTVLGPKEPEVPLAPPGPKLWKTPPSR